MNESSRYLTVATDLTSFCNLKCRMCYFHVDSGGEKLRVSHKRFRAMFGSFGDRIRTIGLSCSYEPLLVRYRDLSKVLDFIEEQGITESFLITNATCLSKRVTRRLVDSALTTLQVSFDSHIREKYSGIRIGADFDKVVKNLRYFADTRKKKERTHPLFQFNAVLGKGNIEDTPDYLDFIAGFGADAVDFRHLVVYEGFGLEEQSLHLHKALANEYFDIIRNKCAELKLHIINLPDNFALEPPIPTPPQEDPPPPSNSRVCTIPLGFMSVLPNGDVRPCAFWFGEKPLGNLVKQDFDSLWNSEEYARHREEVSSGVLTRHCCRTCPSLGAGCVDDESSFSSKGI